MANFEFPLKKGLCLPTVSNDYCFRRATQEQLSQCNRRITVWRAVIKPHKGLKGTNVFGFGCSVRNLKNVSKFKGRNTYWGIFIVKLQRGIAYKKAKVKFTRATLPKRDAYTETLTQVLSYSFSKKL